MNWKFNLLTKYSAILATIIISIYFVNALGGSEETTYEEIPLGISTLVDGKELVKISDKHMTIQHGDSTFTITADKNMKSVGDISKTNEWQYIDTEGIVTEVVESNKPLIQKGDYICENNPYYIGDGFARKRVYENCLYYPPKLEEELVFNKELDDFETTSVNVRNITQISVFKFEITSTLPYDPLSTNYSEGLISCWPFESDGDDTFGTNHLNESGTISYGATGCAVGDCARADDGAFYVEDSVFDSATEYTVSGWISSDEYNSDHAILYYNPWGDGEVRLSSSSGNDYASAIWNSPRAKTTSGYGSDGQMMYLVGVWNTTHTTLYVNGTFIESVEADSFTWDNHGTPAYIGAGYNGNDKLTGYLDEVAIWSRALNQSEVTELYDSGSGTSCDDITGSSQNQSSDTTDPTIAISYPDATTYSSNVTQISSSASDNVALDECLYDIGNGNQTFTCNQTVTGLEASDGTYTWYVHAIDTSGNTDFAVVTFTVNTTSGGGEPSTNSTSTGDVIVQSGSMSVYTGYKASNEVGITDSTSYWICKDSSCSTTCQVKIIGGIIVDCI